MHDLICDVITVREPRMVWCYRSIVHQFD